MAKVRKANRILTVNDNAVETYLKRGYDEIDEKGKVIKNATGNKSISIAKYNKIIEENEKLKKENTSLKGQITKLKNASKEEKKAEK